MLQGSRTEWGGKGELNHCIPIFFAALFFCQVASDFLKAFPHDQVCVSLKLKPTWMVLYCKSFHYDSLLAWGRTPQSSPSLQSLPVLFLGFSNVLPVGPRSPFGEQVFHCLLVIPIRAERGHKHGLAL